MARAVQLVRLIISIPRRLEQLEKAVIAVGEAIEHLDERDEDLRARQDELAKA